MAMGIRARHGTRITRGRHAHSGAYARESATHRQPRQCALDLIGHTSASVTAKCGECWDKGGWVSERGDIVENRLDSTQIEREMLSALGPAVLTHVV